MSTTFDWLDGRTVAHRLGLPDNRAVKRLVERGEIRTRDMPVRAIYNALDVARLYEEITARSAGGSQKGTTS